MIELMGTVIDPVFGCDVHIRVIGENAEFVAGQYVQVARALLAMKPPPPAPLGVCDRMGCLNSPTGPSRLNPLAFVCDAHGAV